MKTALKFVKEPYLVIIVVNYSDFAISRVFSPELEE